MSVFVFSDIHGQRALFDQIMNRIGPNDRAFFLGDAIDRGPEGWQIFKELMDDPRITFIKGNHEDMMVKALRDFPKQRINRDRLVWNINGNEPTLSAIKEDNPDDVREYLNRASKLPIFSRYTNEYGDEFWLSHAGCDYVENINELPEEDLIWDRNHFIPNKWYHDNPDNVYIIHGHIPIPHLVEELSYFEEMPEEIPPGIFIYAGGHKVDIDCGAHYTDCTVLLNLDTWEEEVFTI